nr:MAG TPA: adenine-specific methyltransferase [Caudoviricetes sp.]
MDCIVSNPPFSKRDNIFLRLYELGLPFAMIMNNNGLFDSKAR